MSLIIDVKADDLLFHLPACSAGLHHRKMVRAMIQQTADATTSGVSCLKSLARAASTTADSSQSWARLIMMSKTNRACHTAVRPRG